MNSQLLIRYLSITSTLSIIATALFVILLEIRLVNGLIAAHVILGSLAFVVGGLALIAKKGGRLHKLTGTLFFLLMTLSAVFTLIVATMPFHFSTSMFQISVMTLYFLLGGIRSLYFKNPKHHYRLDYTLIGVTASVSLFILFYSKWLYGGFQPLQTVFGVVAIGFCLVDLWLFSQPGLARKRWLVLHLSKMLAGYATAVTGFFVAQKILGGYFDWFAPTVLTLLTIFYWMLKLNVFALHGRTFKQISKV
ncbi:DUF2306 domain-containing protein [Planctobacterium marinum]|uniref:DUF2306 domain-containing protein n=1 Tax=Planctobacterium marinum TaxID=1631968 RepID=A0AA48HHN0_9ALTE|nr:hypothetical protein MACH26_03620 [Planctobacterium marinum]